MVLQPPVQPEPVHIHWESDVQFALDAYWPQPLPQVAVMLSHLQFTSLVQLADVAWAYWHVNEQ